jgi:UDP-N-acetylmuramyl pentapeptide phosphotransferase/UDP-N-acetylglucosamine-1-phosphate transferase
MSLVVAGAALGFLPHNFPSARMFMGDVGSAPLGFLLAALVLWQAEAAGWWLLVPLGLLHANFVFDTGITLVRRIFRSERWYEAHREHFYQRFVRAGKTHPWVTLGEAGLQILVIGLLVLYLRASVEARILLAVVVLAIWMAYFCWAEVLFWRFASRQRTPAALPPSAFR